MKSLFVPLAQRKPHWFFRYRIIDRTYISLVVIYLVYTAFLLSRVRNRDVFNLDFIISHEITLGVCGVLMLFGISTLFFKHLIYPFIVCNIIFIHVLGLGALKSLFRGGYEPTIATLYFDQTPVWLFYGYIAIKCAVWAGHVIAKKFVEGE
jgi:hypothetical protein